jgi:NADH-quinone oxidoreductase subunit A
MLNGYLPVAIFFGLILAFGVGSLVAAWALRPARPTASKSENYECGAQPIGEAWVQFPVGFYLVALIFLVFDTLAVFLFPWALTMRVLGATRAEGDAGVHRHPRAGLGLRLPGRDPRVEIKPPVPVIPIPLWKDVKDLKEWEEHHQRRPQGDKHSSLFEQVTEGLHAFPGGFALTTVADGFFNWPASPRSGGLVRPRLLRHRDDGDLRVPLRR